jgi:hypothetical protein
MRFAADWALDLPCQLAEVHPGQLHQDGRRYLPTLVLQMDESRVPTVPLLRADVRQVPVVDRHHRVDLQQAGQFGSAALVCLLCQFRLQDAPYQMGFVPQERGIAGAPQVFGQVTHVAVWEQPQTPLPYQSLYCEYVMNVGWGHIGVRTHATAPDLAAQIGCTQLQVGDWVQVWRPRIDILRFVATAS